MPTTARTVVAVISRPPARWRGSTSRLTAVGPLAIGESACAHESRHLTDGRPDIHARDSLATTCGKPATPPGLQSPPVLDPVRSPCTVPFLLAATTVRTHDATVFTWICTSLAPQGALRRHLHSVHVPPKIMERTRGGVAEIVAHPTFIATSDLNSLPCAVSKHWCEAEESHHGESGGTRNFLEFPNKKKELEQILNHCLAALDENAAVCWNPMSLKSERRPVTDSSLASTHYLQTNILRSR
jgi:hypothetical protein